MSRIDEVLKLKSLLDSGLITEYDFKRKKEELFKDYNSSHENSLKKEIIIGENEKECPSCKCIIDKKFDTCVFCDFDLINNKENIKNYTPTETNNSLKKNSSILLVVFFFIFLATLVFTGNNSNNHSKVKNDTDTITISKKDTTKIFSDTTSIVPKVVDTVAIAIEDSIKKADINKVSSTISSQSVQDFMNKYYQDICQNNFDVSTYFSSNVNQFITLKNTTSNTIDYQINTVAKKEFRNTKINITSSVEETNNDLNDENKYFKFSISFETFRVSKNKNTSCDIDVEIGLTPDFKIMSYRELKYYNYKSY